MASTASHPQIAPPRASQASQNLPSVTFPAGSAASEARAYSTSGSDQSVTTPPSSIYPSPSPHATPDTSPSSAKSVEKKKKSLLRPFSSTSRQSETNPEHTPENARPLSVSQRARRTLSINSPFQRFKSLGPTSKPSGIPASTPEVRSASNPSTQRDVDSTHSSQGTISKGIRSVARSVKKSLHQLDRPLILRNERKPHSADQLNVARPSSQALSTSSTVQSVAPQASNALQSNLPSETNTSSALRTRTKSESHIARSRPESLPLAKSISHQSKKKNRMSALEPSHAAIPTFGSLPQAAAILARPPPDPTTFLAIIPGQGPPSNVSLLSPFQREDMRGAPLTGGSANTSIFPHSIQAQAPISPRPSTLDLDEDTGFTFIRSSEPEAVTTAGNASNVPGSVVRKSSYNETDSIRRVPSNLEDFTGADWSQLVDESICYPNIGTRHRPIFASSRSPSNFTSDFPRDTSSSSIFEPIHPTALSKSCSDTDIRSYDVPNFLATGLDQFNGRSSSESVKLPSTNRDYHKSVSKSSNRHANRHTVVAFHGRLIRRERDPSQPPASSSQMAVRHRSSGILTHHGVHKHLRSSESVGLFHVRSAHRSALRSKRQVRKSSPSVKRRRVVDDIVAAEVPTSGLFDMSKVLPSVLFALAAAVVVASMA
ncbi:uncharacterized protein MELLADRAFT_62571 [Melampsora larici-populina 98AG31]|uniref:Uncharacterized protein n=1 Tax=Melampsora larici-populina (strain 98AG31 / pathotype 3-4-7) TaxID=747676 RepID=F4RJE8_MELLP|nr:uncharacterized protein MELLADRAFT_62571 [Melampsora larici-populina 98AG31]EGG07509.1 hypothetical protein MELLADRAFT_62571 [Melampsora larici-populina 98AG31]